VAVALAAGLAALTVTHWPMAFPLAAAGVLSLRGLRSDAGKATIARLEAIATWTEMLRDTLAGASGLSQALIATAGASPTAIRAAVRRMTDRLTAGMPTEEALIHLASELNDPAADLIIASLVMANRERAQRLGDLLGALAVSAREEITMRLGVEASRASARSAVRMITGFSLGLFVLMSLFARAYLAPYRSMTGQVVLGLVGVVFAFGLYLMGVMIRPRPFPRLEMERAR
jgi:Flp pilus assembly protein TadB